MAGTSFAHDPGKSSLSALAMGLSRRADGWGMLGGCRSFRALPRFAGPRCPLPRQPAAWGSWGSPTATSSASPLGQSVTDTGIARAGTNQSDKNCLFSSSNFCSGVLDSKRLRFAERCPVCSKWGSGRKDKPPHELQLNYEEAPPQVWRIPSARESSSWPCCKPECWIFQAASVSARSLPRHCLWALGAVLPALLCPSLCCSISLSSPVTCGSGACLVGTDLAEA